MKHSTIINKLTILLIIFLFCIPFSFGEIITDGLTHYYSFNVNADDEVGSINGVVTDAINNATNGFLSNGYGFDRTNDRIAYATSQDFVNFKTVSLWYYPTVLDGTDSIIISVWPDAATRWALNYRAGLSTDDLDFLAAGVWRKAGNLTLNEWNHIVITENTAGNELKFYVNGTLVNTVGVGLTAGGTLAMQLSCFAGTTTSCMIGNADEFGWWNRTLNATEIEDLYNNYILGGTPISPLPPYSVADPFLYFPYDNGINEINNSVTISCTNCPIVNTTSHIGNGSVHFDGINDVFDLTPVVTWVNKNYTFSAWISFDNPSTVDQCFIGDDVDSDNQAYFGINGMGYEGNPGGTHINSPITKTQTFKMFTWVIRNNNTCELWENNTKLKTQACADSFSFANIGDCHSVHYYMEGYIDNILIYNYSLGQADMDLIWNNNTGYDPYFTPTGNTAPNVTNISIGSTLYENDDITCGGVPVDIDNDPVNVSLTWFQNISGVVTQNNSYDITIINPTLNISINTTAANGSFNGTTASGSRYLCMWNITDGLQNVSVNSSWSMVIGITSFINEQINPSSPATYVYNQNYSFNISIVTNNTIDTVFLEFGGTNYTMVGIGGGKYNYNISNLGVNTYNYKYFANISEGIWFNNTQNTYTINKATPSLLLSSSLGWTVEPGDETTIEGSGCPILGAGDVVCTLYNSTSSITNPINVSYTSGTYNFSYNSTAGENYSAGSAIGSLSIISLGRSITPPGNLNLRWYYTIYNVVSLSTNLINLTGDLYVNGTVGNDTDRYTWAELNTTGLQLYEESVIISVSGGIGTDITASCCTNAEILQIEVYPTTASNRYYFEANETGTGVAVDTNRVGHEGDWKVAHRGSVVTSDSISYYITGATIDEDFNITVRYKQ